MSSPLSLLQRAADGPAAVTLEPFPHLIIDNALPDALCRQLLDEYPDPAAMQVDLTSNNQRWSYGAPRVLDDPAVSALWREFIGYHASAAFYHELMRLFRGPVTRLYGAAFAGLRPGLRRRDDYRAADILLDAQICGNTPVTTASSVRTAHIDRTNKLFAGLFYLRPDDDDTEGGDLQLYRFRSRYADPRRYRDSFRGVYVDERYLETVATVPYRRNTLILFINSPTSLHGVSVRQPTRHSRLFVNLLGEMRQPLFAAPKPRLPVRLRRKLLAGRSHARSPVSDAATRPERNES